MKGATGQYHGAYTLTFQLQPRKCNKASCRTCREGVLHGPYWYAYTWIDGKLQSFYLGKQKDEQKAWTLLEKRLAGRSYPPND